MYATAYERPYQLKVFRVCKCFQRHFINNVRPWRRWSRNLVIRSNTGKSQLLRRSEKLQHCAWRHRGIEFLKMQNLKRWFCMALVSRGLLKVEKDVIATVWVVSKYWIYYDRIIIHEYFKNVSETSKIYTWGKPVHQAILKSYSFQFWPRVTQGKTRPEFGKVTLLDILVVSLSYYYPSQYFDLAGWLAIIQ